jgi:hypothetical protein
MAKVKNEIIVYKNYAEVVLRNKDKVETGRALINVEDIDLIKDFKWYLSKDGYAVSTDKNKTLGTSYITMHGIIMNCIKGFKITPDHDNKNRLDNRRNNLRLSTRSEQQMNHNKNIKNTSGIIGVNWDKFYSRWLVRISINKKSKNIGYFDDLQDAIITRLKAEKEFYKEFAPQKHLFEQYGIK